MPTHALPSRAPCLWVTAWFWGGFVVLLSACASAPAPEARSPDAAQAESQSLTRCGREPRLDPLVTEWPASEKAHLQSLFRSQPVAVRYDGCELQVIDECRLPGAYSWSPEQAVSNTLRIASKSDLESQLPIGGFR